MTTPLLSVLIPNYNHGKFLQKCFAGLLAQTFTDFEILITDDGSTDGSPAMIAEYATRDSRFKPNYFPTNRGMAAGFGDLISRASTKYIFWEGADDFIVNKDFFKKALSALENEPRAAGFYGVAGIYVSETEKLDGAMGTAEREGYNTPLQCCEGLLKYRSIVTSASCMYRRELFVKHGGGNFGDLIEYLGPQSDYYLNHELAWRYGMYYEKTLVTCQRVFQAKTNYSANLNIFALAKRLAEMETRLRKIGLEYPEYEKDWMYWRAMNLMDSIKKSGIRV